MRGYVEAAVFLALAVAVHLALLWDNAPPSGAMAQGEGGDAALTLASSAEVEAMVAMWEAVPEADSPAEAPPPVPDVAAPPPVPQRAAPAPAPVAAAPALATPPADALQIAAQPDTPPEPEPEVTPEPEPEPETAVEAVAEAPPPAPRPARPAPQKTPPKPQPTRTAEAPKPAAPKPAAPKPAAQAAAKAPADPNARQGDQTRAASAGSAGQRAAGSGGGPVAGNSAAGGAGQLSAQAKAELVSIWGGQIRAKVERAKRHPGGRARGRAVVRMVVMHDGRVRGTNLITSTGSQRYDRAAIQAVERAGRMPAAPDALHTGAYTFDLPMAFD